MIKLKVEPYCHGCREYVPEAKEKLELSETKKDYMEYNFIVTCKRQAKCRQLYERIKKVEQDGEM